LTQVAGQRPYILLEKSNYQVLEVMQQYSIAKYFGIAQKVTAYFVDD